MVEILLWKQCRSSLQVMGNQKREGVGKMRSFSVSDYIHLHGLQLISFEVLFYIVFYCSGSPSPKCVSKTHFKSYSYEPCPGFSLPQDVNPTSLLLFPRHVYIFGVKLFVRLIVELMFVLTSQKGLSSGI